MRVAFTLTGTMPLLMHSDDVLASDAVSEWRKDPANKGLSKAGDDRSPPWSWQTYLYSDGKHISIPSANLSVNLRYAGAQVTLKGKKTFKEASQSGILIDNEFLDFYVNGQQIPIEPFDWTRSIATSDRTFDDEWKLTQKHGFTLYMKRAKVGMAKHIRVRPRFNSWEARGELEVTLPEITMDVLEMMFQLGGRGGLGDWRPACKTPGCFGMYSAKLKMV